MRAPEARRAIGGTKGLVSWHPGGRRRRRRSGRLPSTTDDRAGALATFFTAAYAGVSLPVVGLGVVLQRLSPRVTLVLFVLAAGVGILAAAPLLVRRS